MEMAVVERYCWVVIVDSVGGTAPRADSVIPGPSHVVQKNIHIYPEIHQNVVSFPHFPVFIQRKDILV